MKQKVTIRREELRNEQGLTEQEFLASYKAGDYERPSMTVDIMIFSVQKETDNMKLLLIQRKNHPCIYQWALPGGFVEMTESLEEAAARELKEETGLEGIPMLQIHTFGNPNRDPRTRIISCAYLAMIPEGSVVAKAGDDARKAVWFDIAIKEEVENSYRIVLENQEEEMRMEYQVTEAFEQGEFLKFDIGTIEVVSENTDKLAFDHAEFLRIALHYIREQKRKQKKQ